MNAVGPAAAISASETLGRAVRELTESLPVTPAGWAHPPRCPRCEGVDLEPCDVVLEASDRSEDVRSTHECRKCGTRFRVTPPGRAG